MSHSQFHCILFILRHAWLNLWDKHMTTGRINQVTILRPHLSFKGEALSLIEIQGSLKPALIIKSEQTLIQGLCVSYLAEAVRQHQLSPSRFIYYLSYPSNESTTKLSWEFSCSRIALGWQLLLLRLERILSDDHLILLVPDFLGYV